MISYDRLTCHTYIITANPEAAAVPAKQINIGAPTSLAQIDAPTYKIQETYFIVVCIGSILETNSNPRTYNNKLDKINFKNLTLSGSSNIILKRTKNKCVRTICHKLQPSKKYTILKSQILIMHFYLTSNLPEVTETMISWCCLQIYNTFTLN